MKMQTATVRIVVAAVFAATVGASIPTIGNTPAVGWTSTNIVAPASSIEGVEPFPFPPPSPRLCRGFFWR